MNWTSNNDITFGENIGLDINAINREIYKLNKEKIINEVKDKKNASI